MTASEWTKEKYFLWIMIFGNGSWSVTIHDPSLLMICHYSCFSWIVISHELDLNVFMRYHESWTAKNHELSWIMNCHESRTVMNHELSLIMNCHESSLFMNDLTLLWIQEKSLIFCNSWKVMNHDFSWRAKSQENNF